QIPGVGGAALTTARFVVGQIGTRARVVGLLRLPGDDAALDVHLPRARARTVRAVGGTHDLVVLPALAIAVFPATVFVGDHPVPVGEFLSRLGEVGQAVQKVAHEGLLVCYSFSKASARCGARSTTTSSRCSSRR